MGEYYGNNDWRDYKALQHHGILGMKWGKKNGPPYPLSGSAHSASEKKAGWRKSLSSGSNSDDKVRKLKKKIDKNNAKIEKSKARLNSDKAKKRDEKVAKLEYKVGKHESNLAGKALYYDAHKARTRHLESKKARVDKKNAKDRYKIEKAENKNRKLEKKIEKIENKKLSEISSKKIKELQDIIEKVNSNPTIENHQQFNKLMSELGANNLKIEYDDKGRAKVLKVKR